MGVRMKLLKNIFAIVLTIILISGCNTIQTISKEDLFSKADRYSASESTALFYKGSSDKFDYFTNYDGKNQNKYRVSYGAIQLSRRFPLTEDAKQWVPFNVVASRL